MKKQKPDVDIKPFTADERMQLVQDFRATEARVYSSAGESSDWDRRGSLLQAYGLGLPILPISRCPFTGTIIQIPIDTFNLDGLWWDSENPVRSRERQILSPHYWTLSGAVRLSGHLPSKSSATPGPEVPFVVPDLFRANFFKAVVSQISIGSHVAYPVVYFAVVVYYAEEKRKKGRGVKPFTEWSSDYAHYTSCVIQTGKYAGKLVFNTTEDDITPYFELRERADFDLEKWIRSGHVLWIAPGDESMTLRSDVEGCPYLDLPGTQEFLVVSRGQARYSGGRGIYREG